MGVGGCTSNKATSLIEECIKAGRDIAFFLSRFVVGIGEGEECCTEGGGGTNGENLPSLGCRFLAS